MHSVDIIIPTLNNYPFLSQALTSILRNKPSEGLFHIYVVNNGHKTSCDWINNKDITVWNTGENLGWEGALKYALDKTEAPYVLFLNDDIHIPNASKFWLNTMLQSFINPEVGAVGPSSNVVMGLQNVFTDTPLSIFPVTFLIGFCFLTKREAIVKAGGIDDTLPGGDDLDMSIRLRKAGYKLICNKEVFVYHHGFKTGSRVHGTEAQKNGWNSYEMIEKINHAIIKKHGFSQWWECMKGASQFPAFELTESHDTEGDYIRERVKGEVILDLGCGGNKTLPNAIGVDMIAPSEKIETLANATSQADVMADVSQPLPFDEQSVDTIIARHVLEHLMDSVTVLRQWTSVLKKNGRLIVAVPDNEVLHSVPMNIEHVHGFNKASMRSLFEAVGLEVIEQLDGDNHVSFITIGEKQ